MLLDATSVYKGSKPPCAASSVLSPGRPLAGETAARGAARTNPLAPVRHCLHVPCPVVPAGTTRCGRSELASQLVQAVSCQLWQFPQELQQGVTRGVRRGSEGRQKGSRRGLLYTSPSPRDAHESRMPSSA
eukprot:1180348-Prorocentrum_minimum.AAC.2